MIIPGVYPFGPVGPVWWGVCNTPLHGYDHSGHRPAPWYGHSPRIVAPGGAYSIRPYTATRLNKPTNQQGRRPQHINNSRGRLRTAPAGAGKSAGYLKRPSLTPPRPRKVSKRAAERFRGFGKAGYPKGYPAFFACTNLPLRPAITIRSYRYIPFNIFFDSNEKRTIFVANFHVRCR